MSDTSEQKRNADKPPRDVPENCNLVLERLECCRVVCHDVFADHLDGYLLASACAEENLSKGPRVVLIEAVVLRKGNFVELDRRYLRLHLDDAVGASWLLPAHM